MTHSSPEAWGISRVRPGTSRASPTAPERPARPTRALRPASGRTTRIRSGTIKVSKASRTSPAVWSGPTRWRRSGTAQPARQGLDPGSKVPLPTTTAMPLRGEGASSRAIASGSCSGESRPRYPATLPLAGTPQSSASWPDRDGATGLASSTAFQITFAPGPAVRADRPQGQLRHGDIGIDPGGVPVGVHPPFGLHRGMANADDPGCDKEGRPPAQARPTSPRTRSRRNRRQRLAGVPAVADRHDLLEPLGHPRGGRRSPFGDRQTSPGATALTGPAPASRPPLRFQQDRAPEPDPEPTAVGGRRGSKSHAPFSRRSARPVTGPPRGGGRSRRLRVGRRSDLGPRATRPDRPSTSITCMKGRSRGGRPVIEVERRAGVAVSADQPGVEVRPGTANRTASRGRRA